MVLTLTASALLVLAGVAILRSAGDVRLGNAVRPTPAPTSTISEMNEPAPPTTPSTTPSTAPPTTPSASTPSTPATPSIPPSRTPSTTPRGDLASKVVALVNVERARAGCGPVAPDPALTRAAQRHSDDMAAHAYFSHTSPDGRGFAQRIRSEGWVGGALAENIAAGQRSADAVMQAWMASAGHRANILDCAYLAIGVGVATGGSYGTYWTQAFGA
ncbi:CAP domain-containing protein [Terrabacter sp. 2RAF25]|uniref:CAP domain-containing protein n=1 Tax=Terrabacter sp. 2RAF25 TaxID=3232998 RepID=UPI003F98C4AE